GHADHLRRHAARRRRQQQRDPVYARPRQPVPRLQQARRRRRALRLSTLTMLEFAGTDRFQVLRRLGAGGMGVVYEALDLERNAHVALKTLRTSGAESILRFKNEFRALQDLEHPNLCSLGELISEAG